MCNHTRKDPREEEEWEWKREREERSWQQRMTRGAPLTPYTTRGGAGPGQKNDGGEGEEGGNGNAGKITCQIKKERERNGEGEKRGGRAEKTRKRTERMGTDGERKKLL